MEMANRRDQDIDNFGDVDGSDKFLHKRRKAISKKRWQRSIMRKITMEMETCSIG